MKPIRIAILGYGKIAEDQHVPSITGNPRFDLVATSSRSGQGVAPIFTDWRELIRSVEGLEAVAITTPPGPALRDRARMYPCRASLPARKAADGGPRPDCGSRLPGPGAGQSACSPLGTPSIIRRSMRQPRRSPASASPDGNPVARGRPQMAPGSELDLGARRVRRVRSRDQRLLDRDENPSRRPVRAIRRAQLSGECADPDRRRRDFLQPGGRRAADRQSRLAPQRRRGMDDRRPRPRTA